MARYPHATWRPVQGLATDPPITPIGVILHVSGSNATSLHDWFDGPSKGIESHLHIPKSPRQPTEQYRDTSREADANYRGNSWLSAGRRLGFLSVETQGTADGEWTAYQLDELERFCRWAADTHDFPLRQAPGYRSAGIGWHVMWGAGTGTDSWSNARGKVCPGPKRIAQFHEVLLPRLTAPVKLPSVKPKPIPAPTSPPAPVPAPPVLEDLMFRRFKKASSDQQWVLLGDSVKPLTDEAKAALIALGALPNAPVEVLPDAQVDALVALGS